MKSRITRITAALLAAVLMALFLREITSITECRCHIIWYRL